MIITDIIHENINIIFINIKTNKSAFSVDISFLENKNYESMFKN